MKKITFLLLFIFFPIFILASFFEKAEFIPAHSENYTKDIQRTKVSAIVIHTGEGPFSGIINWFLNPKSRVSSHYVISREGKIVSMVNEENVAWHAGNWSFNLASIGIEHEAYAQEEGSFPQEMYRASANLVRYLIAKWKIPPIHPKEGVEKPLGIIGHEQVLNPKLPFCKNCDFGGCNCKKDPGPYFDWDFFMSLVTGGGKPDLSIENFKIEPSFFHPGDEIKVSALIANKGEGDSIGTFFLNAFLDETLIFEKEIGPLDSNQSQDLFFSFFWPKSSKAHQLKIQIEDPYNYILEDNFLNNQVSRNFIASLNRPPEIKDFDLSLNEEKKEITLKVNANDPDQDQIKYLLFSSLDGILEETDFIGFYQKEFKKIISEGKHRLYLQLFDERKGFSEPKKIGDLIVGKGPGWENLEIETKAEVLSQEKKEFQEEKIHHFPLKFIFEPNQKEDIEIKYCLEENCLPLISQNTLNFPFLLEFSESKDIILRYQALNKRNGAVSEIQQKKIRLRLVDINKDKKVGIEDFSIMISRWQKTNSFDEESFKSDLNADGIVNLFDFSILMANFGT